MDTEDEPTKESAKTIRAINKDTVHKICSGQVNHFSHEKDQHRKHH